MNADRWGRSLLRAFFAMLVSVGFAWYCADFTSQFLVLLYIPTYVFLYLKDAGSELTERLKELRAYLPDDSEYDDASV